MTDVVASIENESATTSTAGPNASMVAAPVSKEFVQCRMYENRFPEVDDLVMVNVRNIAEMGAYVNLLEYNNIEGMILLSELSRRRIRSVQKLIRVGRNEVAVVLRVDKEKGYIDLSKRRVSPEEVSKCEIRFNKSKAVHSVLRHFAEKRQIPLEDLYQSFGWPLYKKYGHAYDAFKVALAEPESVFAGLNIPDEMKADLLSTIKRRMAPVAMRIRADIEVTCYGYEGIDAIKQALFAGEACKTETADIKIKLVAPPLYVLITNSTDKQHGLDTLDKAIAKIEEVIKKSSGNMVIKMKPRAISEMEDRALAALMEQVERENAEISGDEDEESGSEDDSD